LPSCQMGRSDATCTGIESLYQTTPYPSALTFPCVNSVGR
jgi:hypothetical protein